jgi:hypothetical protein
MKIRKGFVSNSSSTSFCIFGTSVEKSDLEEIKDIIKPLFSFIYNEIYVYLLLICIYHIFFFFIVIINLYLLLKLLYKNNDKYNWFSKISKTKSKLKYIHIIYL